MDEEFVINADQSPYTLFSVGNVVYGVSSANVLSIEILKTPTPVIDSPYYMAGIVDFRGDMVQLIDMRKLFKLGPRGAGLRDFMSGKANEQIGKMDSFEAKLKSGENPGGVFDRDDCGLCNWLSTFKTQSNSLNVHIKSIHSPHENVHKTAEEIGVLSEKGQADRALALLQDLKDGSFKATVDLLSTAADAFLETQYDMLVVLNHDDNTRGIIVDEIVSVEYINTTIGKSDRSSEYIRTIAKRDKDGSNVLLLDESLLTNL